MCTFPIYSLPVGGGNAPKSYKIINISSRIRKRGRRRSEEEEAAAAAAAAAEKEVRLEEEKGGEEEENHAFSFYISCVG